MGGGGGDSGGEGGNGGGCLGEGARGGLGGQPKALQLDEYEPVDQLGEEVKYVFVIALLHSLMPVPWKVYWKLETPETFQRSGWSKADAKPNVPYMPYCELSRLEVSQFPMGWLKEDAEFHVLYRERTRLTSQLEMSPLKLLLSALQPLCVHEPCAQKTQARVVR